MHVWTYSTHCLNENKNRMDTGSIVLKNRVRCMFIYTVKRLALPLNHHQYHHCQYHHHCYHHHFCHYSCAFFVGHMAWCWVSEIFFLIPSIAKLHLQGYSFQEYTGIISAINFVTVSDCSLALQSFLMFPIREILVHILLCELV